LQLSTRWLHLGPPNNRTLQHVSLFAHPTGGSGFKFQLTIICAELEKRKAGQLPASRRPQKASGMHCCIPEAFTQAFS